MNAEENNRHNLLRAATVLATHQGDIKHRLAWAIMRHFSYVKRDALPPDLHEIYARINTKAHREPRYAGQSTVESAFHGMHKTTAEKIASDLWELFRATHGI